jgi:hypothetical protein
MYTETTILRTPVKKEPLLDVNTSLLLQDLPGLIRDLKLSNAWTKEDLNAMILLKNSERNVVLVALHEGTEIVSYQSNDSITFQIIEGRMKLNTRKTSAAIDIGQELTLNEKVKYRLTASKETVMLLSIVKDSVRSVLTR